MRSEWIIRIPFTSMERNTSFPTEITLFRADWGMSILTNWCLMDLQKQTAESSQLPIIWLKKKEMYVSEFPEKLDVAIWLDADAMEPFFEYFGKEENPVPARIYQNAILVLFSDVLDFKVTGMQIWSFRPHGMREEW